MSYIKYNFFWITKDRMAEWSALSTGNRGDSSSIPAEVNSFFQRIKFFFSNKLNKKFSEYLQNTSKDFFKDLAW